MKIKEYLNESNTNQLRKELDKEYSIYEHNIQKIADRIFKTIIVPFLKKRNWSFVSGMGTFWIGPKGKTSSYYADDNPNDKEYLKIDEILNMPIDGFNATLADFMRDYNK